MKYFLYICAQIMYDVSLHNIRHIQPNFDVYGWFYQTYKQVVSNDMKNKKLQHLQQKFQIDV